MKKKLMTLGLVGLSVLGLTGCDSGPREGVFDYTSMEVNKIDFDSYDGLSNSELSELVIKKGYLTVGTSPDYAPYSFLDSELNGLHEVQGAESAIAFYIAKSLGLELKIKQIAFDGLTTQLSSGNIDAIFSGLTYKEERAEYYTFTDTYYNSGDGGQVLIVNASDVSKFTNLSTLNISSVTVGAQKGALQEELVGTQLGSASLQSFASIADGVLMLNQNKIDVMASSLTSAKAIVEENENLVVLDWFEFEVLEYGTMGLLQKDNDLVDYINVAISLFDNDIYADWLEYYYDYVETISF